MKKKFNIGNPWLLSYLSLSIFCSIVISIVFLYINLDNMKSKEHIYTEEKLELVVNDLEKQLDTYREIGLKITIDNYYKPFYFQRNKYYEKVLLEDFIKFADYTPMLNEYFLFYQGEDVVFHSNNTTIRLSAYLEKLMSTDIERMEVVQMLDNPSEVKIYPLSENILLFYPLSISSIEGYDATLCIVLDKNKLFERIQTVSGGLSGELAIYTKDLLLFNTFQQNPDMNHEDLFHIEGEKSYISIYYLPDASMYKLTTFLPFHIMALTIVIILVLFVASVFAWRTYKPIKMLTNKFRDSIKMEEETQFVNALDEINFMMETIIDNNTKINMLLEQKQIQLRNQLLILILEGKYTFDIKPYLVQARLILPGPWYFVVIVSFEKDVMNSAIFENLKRLLEGASSITEERYIYTISNEEQNKIYCLCSISDLMQCEEICEEIKDLSESYGGRPGIGKGNTYRSLNNLSASYLEALDNVHKYKNISMDEMGSQVEAAARVYNDSALYRIVNALANDNENLAVEALNEYVKTLRIEQSELILQYQFFCFYSEITRMYKEFHIEMPKQYISLSISTRNVEQFAINAEKMIKDFLEQVRQQKIRMLNEEAYNIYKYVKEHFMEYEMTIEGVAFAMNTNVINVRSAIKEHTGKSYKEYLIYLRMEYAKELLVKHNLTVAETCQRVGYGNISYFIKAFKTHTGMTPANYKNMKESDYE